MSMTGTTVQLYTNRTYLVFGVNIMHLMFENLVMYTIYVNKSRLISLVRMISRFGQTATAWLNDGATCNGVEDGQTYGWNGGPPPAQPQIRMKPSEGGEKKLQYCTSRAQWLRARVYCMLSAELTDSTKQKLNVKAR
jgi:hypothetical protein